MSLAMVSNLPAEPDRAGDCGGMSGRAPYWSGKFELSAARDALREPSFEGWLLFSGV